MTASCFFFAFWTFNSCEFPTCYLHHASFSSLLQSDGTPKLFKIWITASEHEGLHNPAITALPVTIVWKLSCQMHCKDFSKHVFIVCLLYKPCTYQKDFGPQFIHQLSSDRGIERPGKLNLLAYICIAAGYMWDMSDIFVLKQSILL